ncbi:MAG: protein kinase [Planctomycetes bacterium]|nr:protein kinase [Planctomycetota bacterium]
MNAETSSRCAAASGIGAAAPEFDALAVDATVTAPRRVRRSDYAGRWLAVIFYPRDFSFVCPTELTAFSARAADFRERGCELLGVSVDSIELHREWFATDPSDGGLGPLQFPLASDPAGDAARAFGVWDAEQKVSHRGLFLIDPDAVLQYAVIHNVSVGRSVDEVLRVLQALQTGGLCPASWTTADGVIDPEAALRPGSVLGHYRIRRHLGSGTFGAVFAAWDLHLERLAALKVLKRNIVESREALLSEARAAARLSHPHVCTIYAVEELDGLPVIVMEHLEGKPLTQVIEDGLDVETAIRLAREIAEGLAAAHEQCVVHGDFKPANVIVTETAGAKILDFGLARSQRCRDPLVDGKPPRAAARLVAGSRDSTAAAVTLDAPRSSGSRNSLRGTPAYMAPEQAEGRAATAASDAYSFGLTLYELLTGRAAYEHTGIVQHLLRLSTADLASELVPHVPPTYQDLLASLLARHPADRPSMSDAARSLRQFARQTP